MLLTILIAISWGLAFLTFAGGEQQPLRHAALRAFTVVSGAVFAFTIVLSAFGSMSVGWLAAAWLALACFFAIGARRRFAGAWDRLRRGLSWPCGALDWCVAVTLGLFTVGTLLSALLYPVVNYDSLTYHMPRVFFWFQNHSVARFPTPEGRQLFSSAFAEYFALNLKTLALGSDRLCNIVQWLSYVFVVLTSSLVALRLGASKRGQQVTALAAAATPMAVLQASTTQNDLTCALWGLAFIYGVVTLLGTTPVGVKAAARHSVWMGVALALAFQTKPTAYLVCGPFVIWLFIGGARKDGWRSAAFVCAVVCAIVLALNAPWYAENIRLLGVDPLGTSAPGNAHVLAKDRSPSAVLTLALKNSSMLLGTPVTRVNLAIENVVPAAVSAYGGELENPRTKESGAGTYQIDGRVADHDVGPGPLSALLALLALIATLVWPRAPKYRLGAPYAVCAGVAFISVAGVISWNHYVNRVLLGALLAFMSLAGLTLSMDRVARSRALRAVFVTVLVLSLAWGAAVMLFDTTNRLVPPALFPLRVGNRDVGYWNTSYDDLRFRILVPQLEAPYKAIAARITEAHLTRIGIDCAATDVPIYPLLALLSSCDVRYVGSTLFPDKIAAQRFAPQAVIEIVPAGQRLTPTGDGNGDSLSVGPVRAGDWVFGLRRTP